MKLETFFENFDQFANAPDAVAKMRGLILRLAMQGKLSEPNKADAPVRELMREVEKDKIRLGLESSAIATNGNSDFSDDETADVIPARWTWVRFGNIARHNAGKTLDKGRNRGELRDYITTSNLYWGFFQLDAVRQMPMLDDELERCTAIKGDLLICEGGEAGRAAVWSQDREISFQNHVHRARFFAGINPYFVQRYFEKLNATGEIEKYRKGVGISNMSGKALASIPIPLPPLAEQKRIVAKVDELMALCDRLEAQQQEREMRQAALARASLARFADAPTPDNLDFIFHKSYTIPPADLRKSILTLAVQGKLVPQDPNDEPAEVLLANINRERLAAVKARRISPMKPLPPVEEGEIAYDVRPGRAIARLIKLVMGIQTGPFGSSLHQSDYQVGGTPVINPASLKDGKIVPIESMAIGPDTLKRLEVFRLKEGDIVMARRGEMGRCAIVTKAEDGWLCGTGSLVLRMPTGMYAPFLALLIGAPEAREYLGGASVGTTMQNLNQGILAKMPVGVPPLAEQRRIVAKVEQLMALVDALETQLAASRATAANLLSALVAELTGESNLHSRTKDGRDRADGTSAPYFDAEDDLLKVAEVSSTYSRN